MEGENTTAVCFLPRGAVGNRRVKEEEMETVERADSRKKSTEKQESWPENDTKRPKKKRQRPGEQFFQVLGEEHEEDQLAAPLLDSEDEDALAVKDSDIYVVAATSECDANYLLLYTYDNDEGAFYVRSDTVTREFTLCMSPVGTTGLVATGGFSGHIDMWDVEVLGGLEPTASLEDAHEGPILDLAIHPAQQRMAASGGADGTVKLWDLNEGANIQAYSHHDDKVQKVVWHPSNDNLLLSASFDKSLHLLDVRTSKIQQITTTKYDVENLKWLSPYHAIMSDEKGYLETYDLRKLITKKKSEEEKSGNMPLWRFRAHKKSITSLATCANEGVLVSSGLDGRAKVWNAPIIAKEPQLVFEKKLQAGSILCVDASEEENGLFAFGGDFLVLWQIFSEEKISSTFNHSLG